MVHHQVRESVRVQVCCPHSVWVRRDVDRQWRVGRRCETSISIVYKDGQVVGVVIGDDDVVVCIPVDVGQGKIDRLRAARRLDVAVEPARTIAEQDRDQRIA